MGVNESTSQRVNESSVELYPDKDLAIGPVVCADTVSMIVAPCAVVPAAVPPRQHAVAMPTVPDPVLFPG